MKAEVVALGTTPKVCEFGKSGRTRAYALKSNVERACSNKILESKSNAEGVQSFSPGLIANAIYPGKTAVTPNHNPERVASIPDVAFIEFNVITREQRTEFILE